MKQSIVCVFVLSCAVVSSHAAEFPDAPDFKRTINYVSWYKKASPSASSSDNAYAAYAEFMPHLDGSSVDDADWPKFFGMISMPAHERAAAGMSIDGAGAWPPGPGPWRPEFHSGWNGSYDRTKDVLRQYRDAAKRSWLVSPVNLSGSGKGSCLVSLRYPYTQYQRECCQGLFEGAWQVTDQGISINRMRSAIESNLRTAGQMRESLSIEEQAAAIDIRLEAYRNIRWAFAHGILNEGNASKVSKLLRKVDGDEVVCAPAMSGECAKWLDGLQYIFTAPGGGKGTFDGNRYRDITGQTMGGGNRFGIGARLETDPEGSGHAILGGYQEIRRQFVGRYSAEKLNGIRSAFDGMANATKLNKGLLMGGGGRLTGLYANAGRAEVERRGAIVVAELFAYKAKHGSWPKELKELGSKVVNSVGEDIYSGSPLVYLLMGEEPILYSVGLNGADDGGASGSGEMDDVMLWPIQESKRWIASCALNMMPESELTKLSDVTDKLKDKVVVVEVKVEGVANEISKEHGRIHRVNVKGQGSSRELLFYEAVKQDLTPHQMPETGSTYRIRVRISEMEGAIKMFLENAEDLAPAF